MSNRKIISILTLFLVVLTSFRMVWIASSVTPTQIEAEQGVLDLRNWDFDENPRLNLDGEWEFSPDTPLTSGELEAFEKVSIVKPGKWTQDTPISGTYRLRILVADEAAKRHFGLLLPHRPYVGKVIVNDEVVIDNEKTVEKSGFLSRSSSITTNAENEIEILNPTTESFDG